MHYKFLNSQILLLNNGKNRLAIPEGAECAVISQEVDDCYIIRMLSPKGYDRFTVRLPKCKFDTLIEVKDMSPVYMIDDTQSSSDTVESIDDSNVITAQVIQPFRKKSSPEFTVGDWYIIENFKYPVVRFDGYDNGLYVASVPSKKNSSLIKLNIDEAILHKYHIRKATNEELYNLCPNKQYSLVKNINSHMK